jgi:hypothetical protein
VRRRAVVEVREDSTMKLSMSENWELEYHKYRLQWESCHPVDLRTPWWAS